MSDLPEYELVSREPKTAQGGRSAHSQAPAIEENNSTVTATTESRSLAPSVTFGITERDEGDAIVLSPVNGKPFRRLIYLDNYGGRSLWAQIKNGDMPPHHLKGCIQLARMGYEVALVEPLMDFYPYKNAFPHDLRLLKRVRLWLGSEGLVYCGHNVLFWLPAMRRFGVINCRIVSHLWAREPLNFAKGHDGIIALTPAGAAQAHELAPKVKTAKLAWGTDLSIYPRVPYNPRAFFSCGIALRDFKTLSLAAAESGHPVTVLRPGNIDGVNWSQNVRVIDSGKGWSFQNKRLSYAEILNTHHAASTASLLILKADPAQYTAVGFTEVIEAMAMGRPIIMTRTGALPTEIDVEAQGCGIFVPPNDPGALAAAMHTIATDIDAARAMGARARQLAETYYNIDRFAQDVHQLFQSL